ncbi:MAG: hypothetical protein HDQ87_10290, partial [Clostridia bacterium]|nr:hypothetical protein [Clostridia bacterium]
MERVALKGTPFPPVGPDESDLSAELARMKTMKLEKDTAPKEPAADSVETGTAAPAMDQPQIVSAQKVAHMKAWNPADLEKARQAKDAGALPKPAPGEDQPKVVSEADLPHKTPWSTLASEEADKLAHEAELQAAQAEIDAKQKQSLFEKEETAADKVAAADAAKDAEEL